MTSPPVEFQAVSGRPDGDISVTVTDDLALVEVWSESGIGDALVKLTAGQMPAQVLLRLHLAGLEEFRFAYGDVVITASAPANGERPIVQSVALAEAAPVVIGPASPYWLQISHTKTSASGDVDDGYFDVLAPPDFGSDESAFAIAWIDFYR